MTLVEIAMIGVGLSMDALAVSVASGIAAGHVRRSDALKVGAYFGGFQAVMPLAGWLFAKALLNRFAFVNVAAPWIASGVLWLIAAKMLWEAFRHEPNPDEIKNPFSHKTLLLMAIATSIDALAVGIGFGVQHVHIAFAATIIGLTTFAISFAGIYAGRRFGALIESRAELGGAILLILAGAKMIFDHLAKVS